MAKVEPTRLTLDLVENFVARVDRSGGADACWRWTGAVSSQGYGKYGCSRKNTIFSHRTAYAVAHDVWPIPRGKVIAHRCDNRLCCNPAHLWLATSEENIADRVKKGRCSRKLTPEAIAEIRAAKAAAVQHSHCDSWGVPQLAKKFGVDPETIRRVVRKPVAR